MRYIIPILIAISLTITPAHADETHILTGSTYFETVHQAITQAQESIYVAIYLINTPAPPDPANPASILLQDLISAHQRGVSVKVILDDSRFKQNYNAYKLLRQAGIDTHLDSPARLLHGKAIII